MSQAKVNEICAKHKGVCTWGFSQTDFIVMKNIFSDSRTRFGICAALSAHWIKHHAHEGSLANLLGGGGVGPLNIGKLKEIKVLHSTVSGEDGGAQAAHLEMWLRMNDVLSLGKSRTVKKWKTVGRVDRPDGFSGQSSSRAEMNASAEKIDTIEHDIVLGMRKFNSCYARVNFGGTAFFKGAGHAVAVWLGQPSYASGGDALFFDPNYGEFWFKDKQDFFAFFPEFYRATYRSAPLSFNKNWEVLPCAKRAW